MIGWLTVLIVFCVACSVAWSRIDVGRRSRFNFCAIDQLTTKCCSRVDRQSSRSAGGKGSKRPDLRRTIVGTDGCRGRGKRGIGWKYIRYRDSRCIREGIEMKVFTNQHFAKSNELYCFLIVRRQVG